MSALRLKQDPEARAREAVAAILTRGDFSIAADVVRNGESISDELRAIIAAKLEGTFRAKPGKKESKAVKGRKIHAVICNEWLILAKGWGDGQSDARANYLAQVFGVSSRMIYQWLGDETARHEAKYDPYMQVFSGLLIPNRHLEWAAETIEVLQPFAVRLYERNGKPVSLNLFALN